MEKDNTNTPQPELITEVPGFEPQPEPAATEAPEQIVLPKDIFPEARQQELGGVALASQEVSNDNQPVVLENGRFNNGVIPAIKSPGIPIENPGSGSYIEADANGTLPDHITLRPQ